MTDAIYPSVQRVNYNILKALSSYHGLSDMNDYAIDILNCIYECYSFKDNIIFNLNIGKQDPIRPREIAKLMYGITGFFEEIADESAVSTSLNLNSPGKVCIKLKDGFRCLKKKVMPLVAIYIAVVGGSGFGFEFPGLIGFIKEAKLMEIEIEKEKVELDGKQLENYQKVLQLIKEAEEEGIDLSEVITSLDTLDALGESLNFETNEQFAEEKIKVLSVSKEE